MNIQIEDINVFGMPSIKKVDITDSNGNSSRLLLTKEAYTELTNALVNNNQTQAEGGGE